MENKSTFKLIDYASGAEIGKPIEEIKKDAFKLYEKIKLHEKARKTADVQEIKKFLMEVYLSKI